MNRSLTLLSTAALIAAFSSCQPVNQGSAASNLAAGDIPTNVAALIAKRRPDFVAKEVQKKVRGERTYYDIEGTSRGAEIEFDVLMTKSGPKIVEIQRDLKWTQVPLIVRATYRRETKAAEPIRIIESVQTDDSIIYEFFLSGPPSGPRYEIRTAKGQAPELLTKPGKH